MIIGTITWILSLIGIYGFFNGLLYLTIIGMIATIIEFIIGFITGKSKSLFPWFSLIIAFILYLNGNNFFNSLAITLCFINAIGFLFGLIFIIFAGKKNSSTDTYKE